MAHQTVPDILLPKLRTLPSPRQTLIASWGVEARAPSHLLFAPVNGVGFTWNREAGPAPVPHQVCQPKRG